MSSVPVYSMLPGWCRLCLQQYPNKKLVNIFGRELDFKRQILAAVGVKTYRSDLSTQLCFNCKNMVSVIVSFRQLCQETNKLLTRKPILESSCWKDATDAITYISESIYKYRNDVLNKTGSLENPLSDTKNLENVQLQIKQEIIYLEKQETEMNEIYEEESIQEDSNLASEITEPTDSGDESEETNLKKKKSAGSSRKTTKQNEKVMCDTCGQIISQVCLEGHLNRHLGIKPFVCEIEGCGRRLHSKYSLQQHRHLHKSINRFYDCQHCGKRIKGTSSWLRHKKMHTEEPKFTCEVCGKKFRRGSNLKLHSVVHTGVAQFPCEICGKRFTVKHNLGAHYRTHKKNGTFPLDVSSIDELRRLKQYQTQSSEVLELNPIAQIDLPDDQSLPVDLDITY
ncbi:RB-associated KRAB zinc finger protein-like [Wyeomyia smithii]|uniref:RB-associated KRAB zinc finger protein-like n=1 Tax=Wyeomyia smithii TaxID=174621 RepID=UPI002467B3F5|nr:RB-associated KRAB zinc finger protein-like [Wyeomyia smithii]